MLQKTPCLAPIAKIFVFEPLLKKWQHQLPPAVLQPESCLSRQCFKNIQHFLCRIGRKLNCKCNPAGNTGVFTQKFFHLIVFFVNLPAIAREYNQLVIAVVLYLDTKLCQSLL